MTQPKRILWPFWWPSVLLAIVLIAYALTGCTDSKASGPVHGLEIGDPVLVRYPFPSIAECERFTDALIVVLHKAKNPIPEPMRCS
jgi:hypothetical protein